MDARFRLQGCGTAEAAAVIQSDKYRITVLTDRLIRIEYDENGYFEDRLTQSVVNRKFEVPDFQVSYEEDMLVLKTEYLILKYDGKEFSSSGLFVRQLKNPYSFLAIWYYGVNLGNLHGTARTLDGVDGECELEDGILSIAGCSVIDDSKSLIIREDGFVEAAKEGHRDIYYFGYGMEFRECMKAFYQLCGKMPLIPRYSLGNWWSRYYAYTQEEYLNLMKRFEEERLPFSVAVIDMDWHYVDIDPKYGSGWTGYSWNRELFPNHPEMLKKLHDKGMRVTLNVHPADGVRAFEDCYKAFAERMGVDAENEMPVDFDIAKPEFIEAYFECAHHPLEEEGVDFWWIDWQQGDISTVPGLDPLWMLNHYHFLDNARNNKRPMIFSRYAGIGSHRYTTGFSGDTVISWESLQFQPYFTSTASNVGFGWWSHDIGGHMNGYRDEELEIRWYQFGVFSPIMRLHSTKNLFSGKEPWNFKADVREQMNFYLRFRHRMIPYLYTMNARYANENQALIEPIYYDYVKGLDWFQKHKNEYWFGSELLVNPITSKSDETTGLGMVQTFIPDGYWYDIFTGTCYCGERTLNVYRDISGIPVFAKAGGIVPLTSEEEMMRCDNPSKLELCVFAGASGNFVLYEDDGISFDYKEGKFAETKLALDWDGQTFIIEAAEGDISLIPSEREYKVSFYGVSENAVKYATVDGNTVEFVTTYDKVKRVLTVVLPKVAVTKEMKIYLAEAEWKQENNIYEKCYELLMKVGGAFDTKETILNAVKRSVENGTPFQAVSDIMAISKDESLVGALSEIILA